ncbi:unnamed protein product [Adineta steineri]|uniref:Uncharacterized protein n=1 Tax=Adineta steineri TaxID=433720 RepID=A0A820Q1B1_9BILA|nr:unnamed protein product [Adineta steineri]
MQGTINVISIRGPSSGISTTPSKSSPRDQSQLPSPYASTGPIISTGVPPWIIKGSSIHHVHQLYQWAPP